MLTKRSFRGYELSRLDSQLNVLNPLVELFNKEPVGHVFKIDDPEPIKILTEKIGNVQVAKTYMEAYWDNLMRLGWIRRKYHFYKFPIGTENNEALIESKKMASIYKWAMKDRPVKLWWYNLLTEMNPDWTASTREKLNHHIVVYFEKIRS